MSHWRLKAWLKSLLTGGAPYRARRLLARASYQRKRRGDGECALLACPCRHKKIRVCFDLPGNFTLYKCNDGYLLVTSMTQQQRRTASGIVSCLKWFRNLL